MAKPSFRKTFYRPRDYRLEKHRQRYLEAGRNRTEPLAPISTYRSVLPDKPES